MRRIYLPLVALLACVPAQADVHLLHPAGVGSYFTPCIPVWELDDATSPAGAETLTGVTGSTTGIEITLLQDDQANGTAFTGATAIEAATQGTYTAPTTNADIGLVECDTTGTYQIHLHDDYIADDATNVITLKISDGGATLADQMVYVDLNVSTQDGFLAALLAEACPGSPTADTLADRWCAEIASIFADTSTNIPNTLGTPAGADMSTDIAAAQSDLDLQTDTFLNCEVNTANFAGDTSNFACILTDLDGGAVTQATGDLEGLQIVVTSGDQIREARFINDTTWDGANAELQLQLSRALPAALADAVTVSIR